MELQPKIALFTALCSAVNSPDPQTAIWDILQGYTVTPTAASSSLPESIRQFLDGKRADGLSEITLKGYRRVLGAFAAAVPVPPDQITTDHIRSWLSCLRTGDGLKKSSIQTYLTVIRSFFNWLQAEEKISRNPMTRIRSAAVDRKQSRHPLTDEDVELVRGACETLQERAIYELLISSGCRLGEVVDVSADHINWQDRSLVVHGKGDKTRTVYFSVRAKLAMQAWLAASHNPDVLFTRSMSPYTPLTPRGIEAILSRLGERAGLAERLHPHKLRHTFASAALNAGMDITAIQQLLGHENLATTQIYAKLAPETTHRAYERYVA